MQALASLDVGRRQGELEGFELVQKQIELAMSLREQIASNPVRSRHFSVLDADQMIPEEFRQSGIDSYYDVETGWPRNCSGEA